MCINVMLKVKVGSAVSLVQAVGGGASTPDHVQSHTYVHQHKMVGISHQSVTL